MPPLIIKGTELNHLVLCIPCDFHFYKKKVNMLRRHASSYNGINLPFKLTSEQREEFALEVFSSPCFRTTVSTLLKNPHRHELLEGKS